MSPSAKNRSVSAPSALAGGLAIGAALGTLLWAIEPVMMHWRALPYMGTPLVTVLLLYAAVGGGIGLVAAVIAVAISRKRGLGAHAITLGISGWALSALFIGRDVNREDLTGVPVAVVVWSAIALVLWIAVAVVLGRRRRAQKRAAAYAGGVAAVVYLLVLAAWNPLSYYRMPERTGGDGAPNVVLIVVDALRADHLGAYGYSRDTSPNIDRLAADGVVFDHAFSHGNRTIFAMPALFTSMYPSINGAVGYQTSMVPLADDRITIAEVLTERGYVSAGMMSNIYLKYAFGMAQGFDRTEQFNATRFKFSLYRALSFLGLIEKPSYISGGGPRGHQVTDAALRWLGRFGDDAPFFLFVHYMDVHHPYRPPAAFEAMFRSSPEADAIDGESLFVKTRGLIEGAPPIDFGGAELERLVDLYDGCIRSTDEEIGRLIAAVEARSAEQGRETVYVFTSDHGDEFMEHGSLYHVNLANVELLHVPLIVGGTVPGKGRRVDAMARHIDVLPTIADLAGAQIPDSAMGQSLVPLMDGSADRAARTSYAEGDFCTVMIHDNWQIMYVDTADVYRLYDLAADPRGMTDLAGEHPEVVAELKVMVEEYMAMAASRRQTQRSEATSEMVRQLRALGYVN